MTLAPSSLFLPLALTIPPSGPPDTNFPLALSIAFSASFRDRNQTNAKPRALGLECVLPLDLCFVGSLDGEGASSSSGAESESATSAAGSGSRAAAGRVIECMGP